MKNKRLSKELVSKIVVADGDSWLRRRKQILELGEEQRRIKKKILKKMKGLDFSEFN